MKSRAFTYRIITAVCAFLLLLTAAAPAVSAVAADVQTVTLIVTLDPVGAVRKGARRAAQAASADNYRLRAVRAAQTTVQRRIRTVAPKATVGFRYTEALNGFSLTAKTSQIEKIRALEGVRNVYVSRNHERTEDAPAAALPKTGVENSSVMTQVDLLHEKGYRGEGMLVAIVDTEFDLGSEYLTTEPDDASLLRYKSAGDVQDVIDKAELNAAVSAARAWKNTKVPFVWDYDNNTADPYSGDAEVIHGSHVAGIAAGKNGRDFNGNPMDGVAPEAQLLCLATATLSTAATLAAIDDAIKLGADALNMSWGVDYAESDLYDEVFAAAADAGTSLFVAVGNSERNWLSSDFFDYGSCGDPHSTETCMSVGSVRNTLFYSEECVLTTPDDDIVYTVDQNPSAPFVFEDWTDYVYCGTSNGEQKDLEGKIAVFCREDLTFGERIALASESGAVAVVFLLNPEDDLYGIQIADESLIEGLPTVIAESDSAEFLSTDGTIRAESAVEEITSDFNDMTSFSGWGVGSDLTLEPDIAAPGEMIWSSVPVEEDRGGYTYYSGTSMAAPHMTGASVLLKQYLLANEPGFADKTPAQQIVEINRRAMSTAQMLLEPNEETGEPDDASLPYSPRYQGAGLLQLDAAASTPVALEGDAGRAKCSLGTIGDSFTLNVAAENFTDKAAVYDAVELILFAEYMEEDEDYIYLYNIPVDFKAEGLPERLTVPANGTEKISAKITPDAELMKELSGVYENGFFLDGFVRFSDSAGVRPELSIPFTGFCGDWSAGPVLDGTYWDEDALIGYTRLTAECNGDSSYEPIDQYYDLTAAALGSNPYAQEAYSLSDLTEEEAEENGVPYVGFDPDAAYEAEEYGGISPNGDDMYDQLMLDLFPLRTAKSVSIRVTDAEGTDLEDLLPDADPAWRLVLDDELTVIPYGEPTKIDKMNANVFLLIDDIGFRPYDGDADYTDEEADEYFKAEQLLLPDGEYTVTVEAKYDRDSERTDTIQMKFCVDTAAPTVTGCSLRRDGGKTYLDVSVSDDRCIEYIRVAAQDKNDPENVLERIYPVPGSSSASFSFDVTDADPAAGIYLEAGDYAKNATGANLIPFRIEGADSGKLQWDKAAGNDMAFKVSAIEGEDSFTPAFVSLGDDLLFCLTPDCVTEDGFILPNTFLRNAEPGEYVLHAWDGSGDVFATLTVTGDEGADQMIPGDVNLDGKITSADARAALRSAAGIEKLEKGSKAFLQADTNKDGFVRSDDARHILRAGARIENPADW